MTQSGLRRKPLWIYVTSALFLISPILNFLFSLRGRGEPGWLSPRVWLDWLPHTPPRSFLLSLLLFVTGLMIARVNRWSWWMAMTSLVVLCGYNLMLLRGLVNNNFFVLALVSVLMGTFLWVLYHSEYKQVFLDRRLRWWESKPRFAVNLPVTIRASKASYNIVDISKSGFFLKSQEDAESPSLGKTIEIVIADDVVIPATVVRSNAEGFGVRIEKIGRFESRFLYNWIRVLRKEAKKLR